MLQLAGVGERDELLPCMTTPHELPAKLFKIVSNVDWLMLYSAMPNTSLNEQFSNTWTWVSQMTR